MSCIQPDDLYPVIVALLLLLWHSNLAGAMALWLEHRTLNINNPSLNLPFRILGNSVHSTLPQLTQLYKRVPGNIQWWICERIFFEQ